LWQIPLAAFAEASARKTLGNLQSPSATSIRGKTAAFEWQKCLIIAEVGVIRYCARYAALFPAPRFVELNELPYGLSGELWISKLWISELWRTKKEN
jgi:hypothetical protein